MVRPRIRNSKFRNQPSEAGLIAGCRMLLRPNSSTAIVRPSSRKFTHSGSEQLCWLRRRPARRDAAHLEGPHRLPAIRWGRIQGGSTPGNRSSKSRTTADISASSRSRLSFEIPQLAAAPERLRTRRPAELPAHEANATGSSGSREYANACREFRPSPHVAPRTRPPRPANRRGLRIGVDLVSRPAQSQALGQLCWPAHGEETRVGTTPPASLASQAEGWSSSQRPWRTLAPGRHDHPAARWDESVSPRCDRQRFETHSLVDSRRSPR